MLDPTTLFSYERDVDSRSLHASTLVVTLGSFVDSGRVQEKLDEFITDNYPNRIVGTFDSDQVIDYTAVRPPISLEQDHLTGYSSPALTLREVSPEGEAPFLLLSGPEPNFQWERVAHAVRIIVEQLGVTRTLVATSFPGATPHTRPVAVSRYAGDPKDLVLASPFPGTIEMRAFFPALLIVRMAEAGHPIIGLAAHVPSYAHEVEYYPALPALFTALDIEGGPAFTPTKKLEEKIAEVREALDQSAAENEQLASLIKGFEDNYSRMDGMVQHLTPGTDTPLPGAENLTTEVEDFLKEILDEPENTGEEGEDHGPDSIG